jgi:PleD family two-component response regulator
VETDLGLIKEELLEINQERGAFLCDYGIFKHLYRLEIRAAERSGQPFFICLMTLEHVHRSAPQREILLKAAESLKAILLSSLRKGDVVTRFSATQFIMMLPATTFKNGELVLERIRSRFNKAKRNPDILLKATLEPVFTAV